MGETFTLKNDGGRNVRFTGEEIACASGKWAAGREQNRYTRLTLFRTDGGKYVLYDEYITQWQGEFCSDKVFILDSAAAIYDHLLGEDGSLGRLDKELLEKAAKNDDALKELLVENIE
jgi:hypothetical protein